MVISIFLCRDEAPRSFFTLNRSLFLTLRVVGGCRGSFLACLSSISLSLSFFFAHLVKSNYLNTGIFFSPFCVEFSSFYFGTQPDERNTFSIPHFHLFPHFFASFFKPMLLMTQDPSSVFSNARLSISKWIKVPYTLYFRSYFLESRLLVGKGGVLGGWALSHWDGSGSAQPPPPSVHPDRPKDAKGYSMEEAARFLGSTRVRLLE